MKKNKNLGCYELMLNYNCNARCSFCSQGDFDKSLNAPFSALARNIYEAYKAGYRRLGLTGGEPLVSPDILRVIALGKSVGFDYIRVQTNGIKLGDPAFCRALVKAGLTFCKISLTSDRAAEHDRLMGVPGAYRNALKGIATLRKLKIRLSINVVVSRSNYRRLPEILRSFLDLGVTNFIVVYPVYVGSMADNVKTLGVSLGGCAEYFSAAAELMEAAGLGGELLFLNVPPCFLKGRESSSIGLDSFNTLVTDPLGGRTNLDDVADSAKVRAPACRRCALKGRCAGVDANYARLFGFAGFKPVSGGDAQRRAKIKKPRVFLSDNELCLIEILKKESPVSTKRVLALAKNIVLCRDCADGNSVMNAAQSLGQKGLVRGVFERGKYYWRLTEEALRGGPGAKAGE